MGRSDGRLSNGRNRPIGKPYWSPTHGTLGAKVHDAFPPFPPTKKKKKKVPNQKLVMGDIRIGRVPAQSTWKGGEKTKDGSDTCRRGGGRKVVARLRGSESM